MKKSMAVCIVMTAATMISGDVLVGDFETGSKRNSVGGDWYYFSDAKDSGNSQILNATKNADGSYSDMTGDTTGYNSQHCGKLEYVLGDSMVETDYGRFGPFVGMGTDLVDSGSDKTVDLRNAKSISFWARCSNNEISGSTVNFELVTSDIDDYGYYYSSIVITKDWNLYTVNLDYGEGGLRQPFWAWDTPELQSSLSMVKKLNWEILYDNAGFNASGLLEIDNVYINGINSLDDQVPIRTVSKVREKSIRSVNSYSIINPLGRRIYTQNSNQLLPSSGIYFNKTSDGIAKRIFQLKK